MHCGQALAAGPKTPSDPNRFSRARSQTPSASLPVPPPSVPPCTIPNGAIPTGAGPGQNSRATIGSAFEDDRRRRNKIAAAVIAGVLVLAILAGSAANLLQKNASIGDNSLLKKQAHVPPPVLEKTAEHVTMPEDIRNWLEHLHQTEIARVDTTNKSIANARVEQAKDSVAGGAAGVQSALDGMDDPNSQLKSPVDDLARMIKGMHDQVFDLQKQFDNYPAPNECIPIQAAYDQALGEEAAELGDLGDHLASGDVAKLQSMEGTSVAGIDAAGAKTDRLVGEICDKYNTKKWFSINKDIGPGGVLAGTGF